MDPSHMAALVAAAAGQQMVPGMAAPGPLPQAAAQQLHPHAQMALAAQAAQAGLQVPAVPAGAALPMQPAAFQAAAAPGAALMPTNPAAAVPSMPAQWGTPTPQPVGAAGMPLTTVAAAGHQGAANMQVSQLMPSLLSPAAMQTAPAYAAQPVPQQAAATSLLLSQSMRARQAHAATGQLSAVPELSALNMPAMQAFAPGPAQTGYAGLGPVSAGYTAVPLQQQVMTSMAGGPASFAAAAPTTMPGVAATAGVIMQQQLSAAQAAQAAAAGAEWQQAMAQQAMAQQAMAQQAMAQQAMAQQAMAQQAMAQQAASQLSSAAPSVVTQAASQLASAAPSVVTQSVVSQSVDSREGLAPAGASAGGGAGGGPGGGRAWSTGGSSVGAASNATSVESPSQTLAGAAVASGQVAARKKMEQQAAAEAFHAATGRAAMAADSVAVGQALAAAQDAAVAYSAAGREAAAAQETSGKLQQAALATAAAEASSAVAELSQRAAASHALALHKQAEQQAAAEAYHAAASQAQGATDAVMAMQAAAVAQHAAQAYNVASTQALAAQAATTQLQQQAANAASTAAAAAIAGQQLAATLAQPAVSEATPSASITVPLSPLGSATTASTVQQLAQQAAVPGTAASILGSSASTVSSLQRPTAPSASTASAAPSATGAVAVQPAGLVQGVAVQPGLAAMPAATSAMGFTTAAPVATAVAAPGTVPAAAGMLNPVVAAMAPHVVHWAPSLGTASGSAPHLNQADTAPQPSPAAPPSFTRISAWSQDAAGIARTCKLVCSSGGSFRKLPSGAWDYEGGDTRLVAVPFHCDYPGLVEALEGATAPPGGASGDGNDSASDAAPRTFAPQLKYRLPADPNVWVDLLDNDDVALMFDEVDEARSGASSAARLHLFVQWRGPHDVSLPDSEGHGALSPLDSARGTEEARGSKDQHEGSPGGGGVSCASADPRNDSTKSPGQASERTRGSGSRGGAPDLSSLSDKMEIITPADIALVRFLGSGGYGDVYLARWHGVDVAVKCLNPSLLYGGGEWGSVNRTAILDLMREVDMLGSLRHPNIVWVYGVVLPRLPQDGEEDSAAGSGEGIGSEDCSPRGETEDGGEGADAPSQCSSDIVDQIARGMARTHVAPGSVRPPAMVVEYMAGGSLKSALSRKADIVAGPLTRVVLALDAAKGMEYLHSKNVVHFDLKSANLLLGYRDRRPMAKVADFGLSKEKMQTFVSGVSSQRGTLPWTAPEILRTPNAVTEKIDVFSFGIVMWELWTGLEPFASMNYHALMLRLANPKEHLRPALPGSPDWEGGEAPPELAPGWSDLMQRCWAEDPDERPTFSEIIRELRGMVTAIKPRRDGGSRSQSQLAR